MTTDDILYAPVKKAETANEGQVFYDPQFGFVRIRPGREPEILGKIVKWSDSPTPVGWSY